ncbi:MAG: hypothetical protein KHX84_01820 [Enterocloster asparagiformis]|nr:hypothetical protein [Enterocloster asparagiformis]
MKKSCWKGVLILLGTAVAGMLAAVVPIWMELMMFDPDRLPWLAGALVLTVAAVVVLYLLWWSRTAGKRTRNLPKMYRSIGGFIAMSFIAVWGILIGGAFAFDYLLDGAAVLIVNGILDMGAVIWVYTHCRPF